ncbi:MAG: hypothetical protein WBL20_10290 [Sphingobium sp.]|uniref:hypothetical protein n=1 Tax=Sphingobium sp. TaxID=1912891 RepID=UPI002E225417
MSRTATSTGNAEPTEQAKPTQPRPCDAEGNELDQWGLPIAGPLRIALLAELERPDPNHEPDAWLSEVKE